MTDGMPDFAMPSAEELAAERRAAERLAAERRAAERLAAERRAAEDAAHAAARGVEASEGADAAWGGTVAPTDETVLRAAGPTATDSTAAPGSRAARASPVRRAALRARASALVRAPLVAFAAGGVLVAALVLVPAAVAESAAQRSTVEARDVLAAYVEAVGSGDVEAASAAWMPTGSEASLELLEAGAAPDDPATIACDDAIVGERRATASCEVTLPSAPYATSASSTIVLERGDGGWRVVAGLAEVAAVSVPGDHVEAIGGAPTDGLGDRQWLIPGGYDVAWSPSPLFAGDDLGDLVVMEGGGWLQIDAPLSPEVQADAERTALAFVDACLVDAVTAASCTLEPSASRGELAATAEAGYGWLEGGYVVPVRVTGLGDVDATIVEVEVELADDGTTWAMAVRAVQRWGEP